MMNITQSLSSLSSWSSTASSTTNFNTFFANSPSQQQQFSLIQPNTFNTQLPQYFYPQQQQQQQQSPTTSPVGNHSQFNNRRPITGIHNFPLKNKSIVPNVATNTAQSSSFFTSSTLSKTLAKYSRKVFVGGLPPDIDEDEIVSQFSRFGALLVDWPHKSESKSVFPPKGYAFLIFEKEKSIQDLMINCTNDANKFYISISSPSIKDKPVQIRPWCLNDSDYVMDNTLPIDPRKTIFVGGVPRPLKAAELANIMNKLYGGVCYAAIDTDPELKYPKGAGRVSFSNQLSYKSAINARFVQLQHAEMDKRAEIKPYVLDDQICDLCNGARCANKFAPFFCANTACLQYFCETCWAIHHSGSGRDYHKPLIKEGADRPRTIPYRWC